MLSTTKYDVVLAKRMKYRFISVISDVKFQKFNYVSFDSWDYFMFGITNLDITLE